jgi:hypothetical protein
MTSVLITTAGDAFSLDAGRPRCESESMSAVLRSTLVIAFGRPNPETVARVI